MNPTAKNVLAAILGLVIGSVVNMGLVMIGSSIIPAPGGADATTMEGLREAMHLFEPKNFIFPFLAHALGTLVGASVAAAVAASHKSRFALGIGIFFLIGGIANVFMLPAPTWFVVLDLVVAYIPMALLASRMVGSKK